MKKKITFLIFAANHASMRQASVSKGFLTFMGLFALSCLIATGIGAYDYYKLKTEHSGMPELRARVENQKKEIIIQRKQLRKFADDINELKGRLLSLNDFEQRLRMIAGIEDADKKAAIFGIGGSVPEDLDAGLDLREKHGSLIREMHDQIGQLDMAAAGQEEGFDSLMNHLLDQGNLLAHTPAVRPAEGIRTSAFGSRKSPFTKRKEFHKGLDIANRKGTPVLATADGVISFSDTKGSWGKMVIINHGHGMVTYYAHLSKLLKKSGDAVKRGDMIAEMGNTGRSTGPHLHYEVRLNAMPIDPEQYILN